MSTITKFFGKLVFALLLVIFFIIVAFSIQRYFNYKIGVTTSRESSEWRLMPSVSICFYKKNTTTTFIISNSTHNLQQIKHEVLVNFTHINITERGFVNLFKICFTCTTKVSINFRETVETANLNSTGVSMHASASFFQDRGFLPCVAYEPSGPTRASIAGVRQTN